MHVPNRLQDIRIGSAVGAIESGYSHNDEGQLIAQTGLNAKTITWDAKGRMHSLGSESYAYDPMDYRIGRQGGALGSLDYFLEGEHLESVYSAGVLKEKYFRGANIDELVAGYLTGTDGKSKPYLFHHDALTSNTAVSGHNGGMIQATSFGAFGNVLASIGTSPNRLKYTGREDEGNGCYYYRARYYCSGIGFISEDPIGFAGGINQYAYVNNNPVNGNDPTGNQVYIGGHIAASPFGQLADPAAHHLNIMMMPNNPNDFSGNKLFSQYGANNVIATLGGQPGLNSSISTPLGYLQSAPNFPGDQISNATFVQAVNPPNGTSDTQFIKNLISASNSYQNNLYYGLLPSANSGSYNSNSFVSGVLQAAGLTAPSLSPTGNNFQTPGYNQPILLTSGSSSNNGIQNNSSSVPVYLTAPFSNLTQLPYFKH